MAIKKAQVVKVNPPPPAPDRPAMGRIGQVNQGKATYHGTLSGNTPPSTTTPAPTGNLVQEKKQINE